MVFLLCFFFFLSVLADQNGTVYFDAAANTYTFKSGVMDVYNGAAWGYYTDNVNSTGFGFLEIRTAYSLTTEQLMYAAGLLEGSITTVPIYMSHQNMVSPQTQQVQDFISQNDKWARSQATANKDSDPFWRHVNALYCQFDGQVDGYNAQAAANGVPQLTSLDFLLLNAVADLDSINQHFEGPVDWAHMPQKEFERKTMRMEHCSVLLKLLPGYEDMYFAHTTWSVYTWMLRMYKSYYFDYSDASIKAFGHIWSGYPGVMYSADDYYLTSGGLAITETTNPIFNNTEYAIINPQTLLTWIRVRVANALSNSGQEWVQNVGRHISGTYSNQWIVLDYKLFTPKQPLQPNTLWIAEEIPSRITSADVTSYLERGDWRSYNIPFFPDIYDISGFPAMVDEKGTVESYDLAPRAKIMRRDVGNVTSMDALKYFMRYNDYQNDPYSQGDPHYAISARYDLITTGGQKADGGIDAKLTNVALFQNLTSWVIAGPTTQGQPPFIWSKSQWSNEPHMGQPDLFNFDWFQTSPIDLWPSRDRWNM